MFFSLDSVSSLIMLFSGGGLFTVSLYLAFMPKGVRQRTTLRILGASLAFLACSLVMRALTSLLAPEVDLAVRDALLRVHYLTLVLSVLHQNTGTRAFSQLFRWFDFPCFLLFLLFAPFAFTPAFVSIVPEPANDVQRLWIFWIVVAFGEICAVLSIARLLLARGGSGLRWVYDYRGAVMALSICFLVVLPTQALVDTRMIHVSISSLPSAILGIAGTIAGIWVALALAYRHNKTEATLRTDIERVTASALRDPLTGLYNRAYLFEALHHAVERLRRDKEPFALMMVDLDNFKQINDQMGHMQGDIVLQTCAKVLMRCARPYDIVARYGGDEFVLILQNVGETEAKQVAQRIWQAIGGTSFLGMKKGITVTATLGVVHVDSVPESLSHLIERVDNAMYDGKRQGRNTIVLA